MKRAKVKNEYLFDTKVENMFINEFMISAPGNFVKVYLLSLMHVDLDEDISYEQIAKTLSLDIEEVERAFEYWRNMGLVIGSGENLEFVSMKEKLYGHKKQAKRENTVTENENHILDNDGIKNMYKTIEKSLGRPLNGNETIKILSWMDDYNATIEVIVFAFSYCLAKGKTNIKYIEKVVLGWTSRGFTTVLDVEEYIKNHDKRHYEYKRIMKALGFFRGASEEERRLIDGWFDVFGYDLDTILEGCKKSSGISNPSINYVNKVLENWRYGAGGKASLSANRITKNQVMEYYEKIRKDKEEEAKARRQEVIVKLPKVAALEEELKNIHVELSRTMVSGGANKKSELDRLRKNIVKIKEEIKRTLIENKYGEDYIEVRYACPICKDTGSLESGQQCKCYIDRKAELENKNKNTGAN